MATQITIRTLSKQESYLYLAIVELYGGNFKGYGVTPQRALNNAFKLWFNWYWNEVYSQTGDIQLTFEHGIAKMKYERKFGKNRKLQKRDTHGRS